MIVDVRRDAHRRGGGALWRHASRSGSDGGAVFEATGGQIDALSQDPEVAHMSGNARFRMMAVTTRPPARTRRGSGLAGSPASPGAAWGSR